MILPVTLKPYDDELLYGWMMREAEANDTDGVYGLQREFFDRKSKEAPRFDYLVNFEQVCGKYEGFPDLPEMITKHTPYTVLSAFREYGYQAMQAQTFLRDTEKQPMYRMTLKSDIGHLCVCPDCVKEDIKEKGEPYLHVWHHLPGVKVCAKHGRRLMEFKDNGRKWNRDLAIALARAESEPEAAPAEEHEIKTARFMRDFGENPVWIDRNVFQAVLKERLKAMGYREKRPYGLISSDMAKDGVRLTEYQVRHTLMSSWFNVDDAAVFLAWAYPSCEEFKMAVSEYNDGLYGRFMEAVSGRYELISDFGEIVRLRCLSCGNEFCIHPYAILIGSECPKCEMKMTPAEIVNRQLKHIGDGNYRLLGEFVSYGAKTDVIHDTCGTVRKMRLSDVIWMGVECRCRYQMDLKERQAWADSIAHGFKVLGYTDKGGKRTLRLLHEDCGREFEVTMAAFRNHPFCRCCRQWPYTNEQFVKDMKALTGGEYTVAKKFVNFDKRVALKHKKCGQVTEAFPYEFLYGRRCKCLGRNNETDITGAVSECTGGYSWIEGRDGTDYIIKDKSGAAYKKNARFIMQELTRPTESKLFPVRVKKPITKIKAGRKGEKA